MPDTESNTASAEPVAARVYATGRLDLVAIAPPAHRAVVKQALTRSARIDPWIDQATFRHLLIESGLRPEQADAICATARIQEDESFYVPPGSSFAP
jgi:hypothetical protein